MVFFFENMAASSLRGVAIAFQSYELEEVTCDEEELAQWLLPKSDLVLMDIVALSVVPPPMYLFYLKFLSVFQEISLYSKNTNNGLVVSLSDGCLCVVEFSTNDTWGGLEGEQFIFEAAISESVFGSVVHLKWLDSQILLDVSRYGCDHYLSRTSLNEDGILGFYMREIELSCHMDHVSELLTYSSWHPKIFHQNLWEG